MPLFRNIAAVSAAETSEGLSRRQHLQLTILNLSVLIALVLIHLCFSGALGDPPVMVYVLIVLRALVLLVEAYYLSDGNGPLPFSGSKRFALISIGANLLFAFAVGYVADLHDSHYHVLMLLPIISTAFQFSIYWTASIVVTASALTFLQLVLYYVRRPPFDGDEFFEAATMTVTYFLVGAVVCLIVRQMRADQRRLQTSLGELNQAQARLMAEEKLAAVGRLASAVAHEIRNPVAMIRSSLQIVASNGHISEKDRLEMFEIARKETDRLTQLTSDFLNFAKPRPPERQPTAARSMLEYAAAVVQPQAIQRRQRCIASCEADFWFNVDPFQIHQLLVNLALNALDASGEGATVSLHARCDPSGDAVIEASNPGPAIAPKVAQSIFEPFFTTKPHGTGLGLAIARNIASSHGGELVLAENRDDRVTFTCRLPAVAIAKGTTATHGASTDH